MLQRLITSSLLGLNDFKDSLQLLFVDAPCFDQTVHLPIAKHCANYTVGGRLFHHCGIHQQTAPDLGDGAARDLL